MTDLRKIFKIHAHKEVQKKQSKTWFAKDSEEDASKEDGSDAKDDAARDRKKHPPLQNWNKKKLRETEHLPGKNS